MSVIPDMDAAVEGFLGDIPAAIEGIQDGMDGFLEVATSIDIALVYIPEDQERLRQALRRARNEARQLCRGSQRMLNALRRVERARLEAGQRAQPS